MNFNSKTPSLNIIAIAVCLLTTIGCNSSRKQPDQNAEGNVNPFHAYLQNSDVDIEHLPDKYKTVRQDALKKISENEVYNSLVIQKVIDQNYLVVLQNIGSSLISERGEEFEIALSQESELKKIPGALQFVVNVIRLDMYGGVPDDILDVYSRYVEAYHVSGNKGSTLYNTNTNTQTIINNDFTLVEALAVFKFNYPGILDEFYNNVNIGRINWHNRAGSEYRYAYLRSKESFNNYLAANYPTSKSYIHYDIATSATDLYDEYDANEVEADEKYKDKLIKVSGEITSISKDLFNNAHVSLRAGDFAIIQCTFQDPKQLTSLTKGSDIEIVGTCAGKISISVDLDDCKIF